MPQGPFNSAIVRRTHGLLEGTDQEDVKYGPAFLYDENMVLPGPTSALLVSIVCIFAILVLGESYTLESKGRADVSVQPPCRPRARYYAGSGPSQEVVSTTRRSRRAGCE